MKTNLNVISKKTALYTALLGVLMAASSAYAGATFNTDYISYDDSTGSWNMSVTGQTITSSTPLVTVTGDYTSDLVLNITGSNTTLTLYSNSSHLFLSGVTTTDSGSISSLIMKVSGGDLSSTYTDP